MKKQKRSTSEKMVNAIMNDDSANASEQLEKLIKNKVATRLKRVLSASN